jgi:hypothetical protein
MSNKINLTEIESAINFWRQSNPSVGEEARLCAEVAALATPYAMMILQKRNVMDESELGELAHRAFTRWRQTQSR